MPPELKKPIIHLSEMTCENCVYSSIATEELYTYTNRRGWGRDEDQQIVICNHINAMNILIKRDYCSEGRWLWFGKYFGGKREEPKIYACEFNDIYQEFARQASSR